MALSGGYRDGDRAATVTVTVRRSLRDRVPAPPKPPRRRSGHRASQAQWQPEWQWQGRPGPGCRVIYRSTVPRSPGRAGRRRWIQLFKFKFKLPLAAARRRRRDGPGPGMPGHAMMSKDSESLLTECNAFRTEFESRADSASH